jgi:hypothetical protein
MKRLKRNRVLWIAAVVGWLANGQLGPTATGSFLASAEARFGRPATPVSVAGVARRSTVRSATYGNSVTAPLDDGIGGPASGIGVLPGAGAGRAGVGVRGGVGVNAGGPVNRVGVR